MTSTFYCKPNEVDNKKKELDKNFNIISIFVNDGKAQIVCKKKKCDFFCVLILLFLVICIGALGVLIWYYM